MLRKETEERPTGVELIAGSIESDSGGDLVQPDAGFVVDCLTGKLIFAAAKEIIRDQLLGLGVRT